MVKVSITQIEKNTHNEENQSLPWLIMTDTIKKAPMTTGFSVVQHTKISMINFINSTIGCFLNFTRSIKNFRTHPG